MAFTRLILEAIFNQNDNTRKIQLEVTLFQNNYTVFLLLEMNNIGLSKRLIGMFRLGTG